MDKPLYRGVAAVFVGSCIAAFVLYAAHPAAPANAGAAHAYLAVSVPWHVALYIVCLAQLVSAAALAALIAASGNPMVAGSLLVAVVGLNFDFAHPVEEALVFPVLAGAIGPSSLLHIVDKINSTPLSFAVSIVQMALTFAGALLLALSKRNVPAARVLAAGAIVLLPVSIAFSVAFDAFALAAYGALCLAVLRPASRLRYAYGINIAE